MTRDAGYGWHAPLLCLGIFILLLSGTAGAATRAEPHIGGLRLPVLAALLDPAPIAQAPAPRPDEDPDALYARREDLASARRAAAIWTARLEASNDFEAAWKLARAQYWLGGRVPADERRGAFELGIEAGRRAIAFQPDRPEGHFWLAANMGGLAESEGMRAGLRYRRPIREALETVLRLDPAYQQGSADRALGRWYYRVPRLLGGSKSRSEEHLRRSLAYNPDSTASRFFLAETLLSIGRRAEAEAELRKVIEAPLDPDWTPEDREFKRKAEEMLARLQLRAFRAAPPVP